MKQDASPNPALQALVQRLKEHFGPQVFLMPIIESDPNSILVTNAEDPRISFTVVAATCAEPCFSVIVYGPWPEGEAGIGPCDHLEDKEDISLDELIAIFSKYRKL